MNRSLIIVIMLICMLFVSSCSVGMAISGKKEPNLSVVQPGADRNIVEMQLGSPTMVSTIDGGKCLCEYEYEIGNEPSAGRAIAHGVMDVLTLGIWEVVGTPIEGFQGDKRRMLVTYDQGGKVEKVGVAAPPPVQEKKAEKID